MARKSNINSLRLLAAVAMLGLAWPLSAMAQTVSDVNPHAPLVVEVNKAEIIKLSEPATTVFVANPDIADVHASGATNILVYGKKPGATTVYVLTNGRAVGSYDVEVQRPVGSVRKIIDDQVPDANVNVASTPNGLVVTGHVTTPGEAQKIEKSAQQYLGEKDKLALDVVVDQSTQVNLQVRVVEVSRQAEKDFGFNWGAILNNGSFAFGLLTGRAPLNTVTNAVTGVSTTTFGDFSRDTSSNQLDSVGFGYRSSGGSANISTLIDALQADGLVTILAQPNLTAISGATANFLAGGEIPVPVSQGNQEVTIEWKHFGVSVDFTPTVLDANRISINVRPEVSELSSTGAVSIGGLTIPSISVRRAQTTVELASGQSFAIAGLYQDNIASQMKNFPWLADIPVLGALFRSSSFKRNESELVIVVTPYIVKPVSRISDVHLPGEGLTYASDLERILLGRLTGGPALPNDRPHLSGDAGFMLEK